MGVLYLSSGYIVRLNLLQRSLWSVALRVP
jgi:hypothetical protein